MRRLHPILLSAVPLALLRVDDWLDSDAVNDTIDAPWVNAVTSRDGFAAGMNLTDPSVTTSLNKLSAKNGITGAVIRAVRDINRITAGLIEDSVILAGVAPTVTGLPVSGADFVSGQTIGKVVVRGIRGSAAPSFNNSVLAASRIAAVRLREVRVQNDAVPFGLAAGESIGRLLRPGQPALKSLTAGADPVQDVDFFVGIV